MIKTYYIADDKEQHVCKRFIFATQYKFTQFAVETTQLRLSQKLNNVSIQQLHSAIKKYLYRVSHRSRVDPLSLNVEYIKIILKYTRCSKKCQLLKLYIPCSLLVGSEMKCGPRIFLNNIRSTAKISNSKTNESW